MLAAQDDSGTNFKEKIRCGEVYRYLYGNDMFQRFCYRCLECNADFESGLDFEEHVISHLLQEDDGITNGQADDPEDVIDLSSDEEIDNAFLYAVEVTSMTDEVSESDLPKPLKQMLGQQSTDVTKSPESGDKSDVTNEVEMLTDDDDEDTEPGLDDTFPCKGLRNQALHQYADPHKSCSLCPAYFCTKKELENHSVIHAMTTSVECPHCYEVFVSDLKLHQHLRTRRKKAPPNRQNGAKRRRSDSQRQESVSQSELSANTETDSDVKVTENDGKKSPTHKSNDVKGETEHIQNEISDEKRPKQNSAKTKAQTTVEDDAKK